LNRSGWRFRCGSEKNYFRGVCYGESFANFAKASTARSGCCFASITSATPHPPSILRRSITPSSSPWDGVGEWATTTAALGNGHRLEIFQEIHFPHSLGLLYSAFTYYLGFKVNSGEYKVMGLAPYGQP